MPGTLILELIK